jgi:Ca-activated chloride channel family protein
MTKHISPLLALAAILAVTPSNAGAQTEERSVYVSVRDKTDKPVTDLSAGEFVVREGGMAREVLRVAPATEPAQIALLVDTSAAITPHVGDIRRALSAFFKELGGQHELALIGYGERPTVLVDYTRDVKRLENGLGLVFQRPNSGTELMDAIVDVSRGLQKRKAPRPVMVIFNVRGQEFGERSHTSVSDELKKTSITLHVIALSKRVSSDSRDQELELTFAEATKMTGGRRDELLTTMALGDRLHIVLDDINNQYKLTYARPKTLIPPDTLDVSSKRADVSVRARQIP